MFSRLSYKVERTLNVKYYIIYTIKSRYHNADVFGDIIYRDKKICCCIKLVFASSKLDKDNHEIHKTCGFVTF